MITKYIKDSITNTELRLIAHGVNCQNKMESGVAKVLYQAYPEVKKAYHEYYTYMLKWYSLEPKGFLGAVCPALCKDKSIFNLFTQLHYGYDGQRYVNYGAIATCFIRLTNMLKHYDDKRIAIPKIGCGLAGGDWKIVEQIINDCTGNDLEVWVYEI